MAVVVCPVNCGSTVGCIQCMPANYGVGLEEIQPMWNPTQYGWKCPKCERVYSPDTSMCLYCPPKLEDKESSDENEH